MEETDVNQMSPLTWAYIGDCIYEKYVREYLITNTKYKPHKLHIEATKLVKASAQAHLLQELEEILTDDEKDTSAKILKSKLKKDGVIVIADTMYDSEKTKSDLILEAKENGYTNLLHDLNTEFYSTHDVLTKIFEKHGFHVSYQQMNKFLWILTAKLK